MPSFLTLLTCLPPCCPLPCSNGILLCDLAAAVTGRPVKRANPTPCDVRTARANILLALDHLGLLADVDEEHLVSGMQ